MRNQLRETRKKKGLTQQELAQRSGITQGTISNLESETPAEPTWLTVYKLAHALRAKPEHVFPVIETNSSN